MVTVMAQNGYPNGLPPPPGSHQPNSYVEFGREYHTYHKGVYMFPCDEQEMDRMDIFHKFFLVARKEVLHTAPLIRNYDGPRILDLGCGTGIWAIDMADKYPHAEVYGWDLARIQPPTIPSNLSFRQRNFESPWHGEAQDAWDLIHMRTLAGSVQDWNSLYAKIWRHLKPNFGHLEQVELDLTPRCDDGSLPPDSALNHWWKLISEATERATRPLHLPDTRHKLSALGFVDITEQIIKVPVNPWPNDPHMKDIGRWFNLGMNQGIEGGTLAPLMRVLEWSRKDVDHLVQDVLKDINMKRNHVYFNMHIFTARRPQ